ncbi:histidine ammonia-lyase [Benzoatithermus flavus]|uniref:Histidine ammonia-lyase n=1 Tax=Benzoatithermus flavus TaxID=3108223 RepID=A0ABU8XW79_9PROT
MSESEVLVPGRLRLDALERWMRTPRLRLALEESFWPGVERAAALVAAAAAGERPVYGVNTGFGKLARVRIPPADIEELQRRLVLSHMCGVGPTLDDGTVRLVLVLKAASLSLGRSGVRRVTIEALLHLLAHDALPVVPAQGSVGASGDLAPLAHVAGALVGIGRIRLAGDTLPAGEALAAIGLAPLTLGPKEGLALLNGTQVSTALALSGLFKAQRLFDTALVAGAMSTDAAQGSDVPFDPRIQRARNQPGQAEVAHLLARLLAGSEIRASHLTCERVQDPYSLRCQPQVMGAVRDLLIDAGAALEREANGVSDNPLVFAEEGEILSGGNFHAEPVAFAADRIAAAMAETGNLAERRVALLTDPGLSGLPAFLTPSPGLNSGFMLPQVVAAALATENKHLAHPVATDTIPTCANQEDHVSLATYAARRLHPMAENLARLLAVELLAAAQGIELRRPLRSSAPLERALVAIREVCPFLTDDRPLGEPIEAVAAMALEGRFRP